MDVVLESSSMFVLVCVATAVSGVVLQSASNLCLWVLSYFD